MSVAARDPTDRDASSDDGAADHSRGSFFGRRKGHKLRFHQADLIEHLLPRLSLDIASPSPPDLADLFDAAVDDIRLEIGFGGGEHLIAEALAFPNVGFIGCEPYVNGMAKILAQIEAHAIGNIGCSLAMPPSCWHGRHHARWRGSISFTPIRGRSGGTGSGASCRTQPSPPWHAF